MASSKRNAFLTAGCSACLLFIACLACQAQNLVPNPSFEVQDSCPYTVGFADQSRPVAWDKWNQSPEYFHSCALPSLGSDTLLSVPQNGMGFQQAWDGQAYVGMFGYGYASWIPGNDYREYVGCELLSPLQVGSTYYLSLYYNMAMGGNYWAPVWACNNMGMLFTTTSNAWMGQPTGPHFATRNFAHLYDPIVNMDTAGWTMLSGSFVADSAYQYLVLGNFFSNGLTDTIHLAGQNSLGAYFFVDGVCVSPSPEGCPLATGVGEKEEGRDVVVFPNPASEEIQVAVQGSFDWELFDCTGRLVRSGVGREGNIRISIGDQPNGQYILRLKDLGVTHVKFVVLH